MALSGQNLNKDPHPKLNSWIKTHPNLHSNPILSYHLGGIKVSSYEKSPFLETPTQRWSCPRCLKSIQTYSDWKLMKSNKNNLIKKRKSGLKCTQCNQFLSDWTLTKKVISPNKPKNKSINQILENRCAKNLKIDPSKSEVVKKKKKKRKDPNAGLVISTKVPSKHKALANMKLKRMLEDAEEKETPDKRFKAFLLSE